MMSWFAYTSFKSTEQKGDNNSYDANFDKTLQIFIVYIYIKNASENVCIFAARGITMF
jgi:hypothetical protein